MAEETRGNAKAKLAFALAQGASITGWARAHNIPRPTVYRWAKEPKVRKEIADSRRRMMDRVVGQMVKESSGAVIGIAGLSKSSDSDSVKLKALRTILLDQITVSKYNVLEGRLVDIEERLAEQEENQQPGMP